MSCRGCMHAHVPAWLRRYDLALVAGCSACRGAPSRRPDANCTVAAPQMGERADGKQGMSLRCATATRMHLATMAMTEIQRGHFKMRSPSGPSDVRVSFLGHPPIHDDADCHLRENAARRTLRQGAAGTHGRWGWPPRGGQSSGPKPVPCLLLQGE